MATAFGTTASATAAASSVAAAAAAKNNAPKSSNYLPLCHRNFHHSHSKVVSFRLSPKPKLRFSSKCLQSSGNRSAVVRAKLNEVALGASSNAAATSPAKSAEVEDVKSSSEPAPAPVASEESISQFMSHVSSLVKLVDSRDIVELQLKQFDCELVIRKKEALPPPPSAPIMMVPSHFAPPMAPAAPAPAPAPTAAPLPAPKTAAAALPAPQSPKSSHPPLKCPMAGTFYRSPAPAEPPFVKVGDKVKKGQVLCIIEAMKLMNEIEADQSGTIVEALVDDGKPVSVDTPLFVIQPE